MIDAFGNFSDSPTAPASRCFTITPDDNADLAHATKAIYIGTAGDLAVIPLRGSEAVVFRNLPAGGLLDVRAKAVHATGTTASDLVALT